MLDHTEYTHTHRTPIHRVQNDIKKLLKAAVRHFIVFLDFYLLKVWIQEDSPPEEETPLSKTFLTYILEYERSGVQMIPKIYYFLFISINYSN